MAFRGWEAYPGCGYDSFFEPAIDITHNDGNRSTVLRYVSSEQQVTEFGSRTKILLKDSVYPTYVTMNYEAYEHEDIIRTWTEIYHQEKHPINMRRYASAILYFNEPSYYLTEFAGDWAEEAKMITTELVEGKKVLDSRMGCRSTIYHNTYFEIGLQHPAQETSGRVFMGALAYSGNFKFTFEVDNLGHLRIIPGINPDGSDYNLNPDEVFRTPDFIFTFSLNGKGKGSRNFHDWARMYQIKNGMDDRMTLLNNWENTLFDFNQDLLIKLMGEAKNLGVDMFLLDDGWFGNNSPRVHDRAGLGDWQPMKSKLPDGIKSLTTAAKEAGVKFGIWIEPEMVNPDSDLYRKHPDWAIQIPGREPYYHRNQLVLDMSNPDVQDYVFGVLDGIMKENPDIAYFKWDCNSPITNAYSPYLKSYQSEMYIRHNRGVQSVFERVSKKYPDLSLMLCSSGGCRTDYESLKHFTEFWCSDMTCPIERLYIQWGVSQFYPVKSMCAHVTSYNRNTSVKFRTDVASMCKLGFDIGLKDLTESEIFFCRSAVDNWNRLKPVILEGDQYRLVSPYECNHMAVAYISKNRSKAVLFAYDIYPRFHESLHNVKMQGLDPKKRYLVREINLMSGAQSSLRENGMTYSGDYLMKVGLNAFSENKLSSKVIEMTEVVEDMKGVVSRTL